MSKQADFSVGSYQSAFLAALGRNLYPIEQPPPDYEEHLAFGGLLAGTAWTTEGGKLHFHFSAWLNDSEEAALTRHRCFALVRAMPESRLDEAMNSLIEIGQFSCYDAPQLPSPAPVLERGHSTVVEMRPQQRLSIEAS